jgi:hypothetical protein
MSRDIGPPFNKSWCLDLLNLLLHLKEHDWVFKVKFLERDFPFRLICLWLLLGWAIPFRLNLLLFLFSNLLLRNVAKVERKYYNFLPSCDDDFLDGLFSALV